ncbi:hypothetical protein RND81_05G047200 [Saponaria officinalis]|uniref:PWWP domain-containing protein n=1 Tax=Saponaria officinalis TaxID=3572 RepID=A0AAW1KSL0_SAPOF
MDGVSSGESGGVLDSGAGSIVWVRRRNGSWWPGRILGPEDLSASHLMSPRSGTPVKLLGREDASVDWYNLEKSKRVKAFRCGEFDDCILRAEASQGLPAKKREKYARREDAILHALQLEKVFLQTKSAAAAAASGGGNKQLLLPSSDSHHPKLNGLPHITPTTSLPDHHPFRGAGVNIKSVSTPSLLYSTASDDSNHTALHPHSSALSPSCFDTSADSDSRLSNKRLLHPSADVSIPKRHKPPASDSSLLLTANHSSLPFSPHLSFPPQLSEDTLSGSSEQTESDSSETHSIEPLLEPGMLLSDAETCMRAQPRLCDKLAMQAGAESISNGESDELSLDDRSQFRHLEQKASGAEVSKWQLKGKRNVRSTGKRPIDRLTNKTYLLEAGGGSLNKMETSHSLNYYHDNGFADDDVCSEDDFDLHAHGFGQRRYMPSQAVARRHSYIGSNGINWELASGRPFNGYWEERGDCFSPMFNGHDMLIDAELKVQANRQGEHVPWVSLMSKLNGKAIIGHPIQIESLEDGSTDMLLSTSNEPRFEANRGKVPSIWRTARRTASVRVPHPHQTSQLYVDEDTEYRHLHHSGKSGSKKSAASNSVRKGSKLKKTDSHAGRFPQGLNKAPRKGNSASNQKTKPLSSIGFDQKVTNKTSGNDTGHYMDGAIKPVGSGPPTVACIPVKLAFSRLLKAVGRPPSGSAANRSVAVSSNNDRKPSGGTL